MRKEVPFDMEDLEQSRLTVTRIGHLIETSWHCEVYRLKNGEILIYMQDYEEQRPYLILCSKTKWDAVCCLNYDVNCGGGSS